MKHRKGRGRRFGRRHRRSILGNPGMSRVKDVATAGIKNWKNIAIGSVGFVGNMTLRKYLTKFLPASFQNIGSYVIGLTTAGLALLVPKVGPQLFVGAGLEEGVRAVTALTSKMMGTRTLPAPRAPGTPAPIAAPAAMSEYLTAGMSEFLNTNNVPMSEFMTADQMQLIDG